MININGLDKFRDFFEAYSNNYVLIGGTACAIIFDEIGESFRATRDLDIVLIIENINDEFGRKLWDFIQSAKYQIETGNEKKCFYRFTKPQNSEFPKMIELFSRNQNLKIPEDAHLIPIHVSDEVSSLSAILLNDDYYNFMVRGKRIVNGISILDEKYLIPFKVKAWCELIERKNNGEVGQTKHIKKHYKDIANLAMLLPANTKVELSGLIKKDMETFIEDILTSEFVPEGADAANLNKILKNIYL